MFLFVLTWKDQMTSKDSIRNVLHSQGSLCVLCVCVCASLKQHLPPYRFA